MNLKTELSDREEQLLDDFLSRVRGGAIPNIEPLDGFLAALACCPDLVMPSEYMPIIQTGVTEDGDLDFESMEEPISDSQRQELLIGTAGGVMRMHRYFQKQRYQYTPPSGTFMHDGGKIR